MQHDPCRVDDWPKNRLIGSNRARGGANDSVDHGVAIAGLLAAPRKNRGAQLRLRPLYSNFEVAAAKASQRGESLRGAKAFVDRRKCSNLICPRIGICVTAFSGMFRHGG